MLPVLRTGPGLLVLCPERARLHHGHCGNSILQPAWIGTLRIRGHFPVTYRPTGKPRSSHRNGTGATAHLPAVSPNLWPECRRRTEIPELPEHSGPDRTPGPE